MGRRPGKVYRTPESQVSTGVDGSYNTGPRQLEGRDVD